MTKAPPDDLPDDLPDPQDEPASASWNTGMPWPTDDPAPPDPISQMREELEGPDILAVLQCGDEQRHDVYRDLTLAEASEALATAFFIEKTRGGVWPQQPVSVTCYTPGAQFGPLVVDVSLVAEANRFLRGNGQLDPPG